MKKLISSEMEWDQTWQEELANCLTHGLGLVLSIVGIITLVVMASIHATIWHVVSFSIYGASLVMLYGASTLYHALPSSVAKRVMIVLDHCSIYILIAGCYTPLMLVTLRGGWGWSLLGTIWAMAILGVSLKLFFFQKSEKIGLFLYLLMGWLMVIALKPLIEALPTGGVVLLVCGGICYTLGVLFFKADKMPFNHAIWHGCVLLGSACHYFCVLNYVLPARI